MAIPETPITRQEMYLDAIARKSGGGGGSTDNRFVVTLTPTAEDDSGTMDKTVGEIREAWRAGKSIYFYIDEGGYFPLGVAGDVFVAYGIDLHQNLIVAVYTDHVRPDGPGGSDYYYTKIYQLTQMGS